MPLTAILFLLIALAALWLGTRMVVGNAIRLAKHAGWSEFFIGLTVVSIGTDLPELVVSVAGSIKALHGENTAGLILGNAIGSCLGQIGLTVGVTGLFYPLVIARREGIRDGAMLGIASFVLMMLATDGKLSRIEGLLLVVLFLVYLSFLLSEERSKKGPRELLHAGQFAKTIAVLLLGLAVIYFSSDWAIENALMLATYYDVPASVIGLFMLGVGTSLPEMAVSIGAIFSGSKGISGGTIIGSTIFDILVPVGVSAVINPLEYDKGIAAFDIPAFLIISLVVFAFFLTRKGISKVEAIIVLVLYFSYAVVKLFFS